MLLATVVLSAACSSNSTPATSNANALAVGVFGECALPAPLQPVLKALYTAMEGHGVELSAEVILLYDHDLTSGNNTLEVLFGGAVATELAGALGLEDHVPGWLNSVGGEGGLLAAATVGLDFGGNWEGITFAIVGYEGGDVFAGSGGAWQVLWTNEAEASAGDNQGFWAAVTVTTNGACKAGGIVTASQNDVGVLWTAWQWLTGAAGTPQPDGGSGGDAGSGDDAGSGNDGGTAGPNCQGVADGVYCGFDGVSGDPNTLYQCTGGMMTDSETCASGCSPGLTTGQDLCN